MYSKNSPLSAFAKFWHSITFISGLFLLLLLQNMPAQAIGAGDISFSFRTGDGAAMLQKMIVDSNNCPGGDGPHAAFVGGILTNTSGSPISGLNATLSGLDTGNGFGFSGGQSPTIAISSLGAGDSVPVYWHISYPCTKLLTDTITLTLTDDGAGSVLETIDLQTFSSISANAGGIVISSLIGPGAIVGQVISLSIEYEFGNTAIGDEFFVQPSGKTVFDAACFRLVGTEILPASDVTAMPSGIENQFYFKAVAKQTGSGHTVSVRYDFVYLCDGAATNSLPYAAQTSGSTNVKYTGNFDTQAVISYPLSSNPLTIDIAIDQPTLPFGGGTVTYTVTVSNPSAYDTFIDSIDVTMPGGLTYDALSGAGTVTVGNSNLLPTNGDAGTLTWEGRPLISYAIAGGGSITAVFTVDVVAGDAVYTVTATAGIQSETVGPASVGLIVGSPTGVTGTVTITPTSFPGDTLDIVVTDADLNSDSGVAETLVVTVVNDVTGESETITLTETGVNTGIFSGTLATTYGTVAGSNGNGTMPMPGALRPRPT